MELKIRFQPKQSLAWNKWNAKKSTRNGIGGARGGSKSGGGRRFMILRRFEYPNTAGLILRRTHPELYESHIIKVFAEFPEIRNWWREQSKEIQFPNGSRLFFGSAQHESDMSSFYSAEYADIMVDEAQEFSQDELERLSGSNRCTTNHQITPGMLFAFMPGISPSGLPPKGLGYLRRVFVDGDLKKEERKNSWAFTQMFAWDNIEWARKELGIDGVSEEQFYSWPEDVRREYFITRTEFGAQLSALTNEGLRNAWLHGKWDTFEGQYFQQPLKIVAPNEIVIQPWHHRWMSGDWGNEHPSAYYWHALDEKGVVTTYRELWRRGVSEEEIGKEISKLNGQEDLMSFHLSWDAFGKLNPKTKQPITKLLNDNLSDIIPRPVPVDATPGSRISGWRWMSSLLDAGKWRISSQCEKLIECLPTLVRDMERNSEDVLKVDYSENYIGDDPADAARYGLQNMPPAPLLPYGLRVERQREAIKAKEPEATDTHMMMALANVQKQEYEKTPRSVPIRRRFGPKRFYAS